MRALKYFTGTAEVQPMNYASSPNIKTGCMLIYTLLIRDLNNFDVMLTCYVVEFTVSEEKNKITFYKAFI